MVFDGLFGAWALVERDNLQKYTSSTISLKNLGNFNPEKHLKKILHQNVRYSAFLYRVLQLEMLAC